MKGEIRNDEMAEFEMENREPESKGEIKRGMVNRNQRPSDYRMD